MRTIVGVAVLAVGVVALGWVARAYYAPHIERVLLANATVQMATSVHGATAQVSGRDITVSGLADGAAEQARLIAVVDALPGRRVVNDALTVLPLVEPFTLSARTSEAGLLAEGHVPSEGLRTQFAALTAGDLTLAAGAPDRHWGPVAIMGLGALATLEDGALEVRGRSLALSGTLPQPRDGDALRETVIGGLPEGYEATFNFAYRDDGTPPVYDVVYDVASGAAVSGKLPFGVTPSAVAAALGLETIGGDAQTALLGDAGAVSPVLAAVAPWLPEVEALTVSIGAEAVPQVEAAFGAGADLALLEAELMRDLGEDVGLTLRQVEAGAPEGTRRSHPLTGRDEVLSGGFWLPVPAFVPSPETCATEVDATLAAQRIGFLSGSATLDARARSAVNALAGVLGLCLREAGLQAEIGGHTDSTGSSEGNLALSRERAEAVRQALIARGLPEAALSAEGYGATQPVADNNTDEGRAANRRTAVRWTQ